RLLRGLGHEGVGARYDHMYHAFRHPRPDRPRLPLLGPDDARAYIASVRGRALDVLDRVDLDPGVPLLSRGFVYGMVVQHEHQHVETMLATLQLKAGPVDVGPVEAPPAGAVVAPAEVLVGGGPFVMGTDTEPWAYDNERPAHEVHVDPFLIDTAPVTNHAFLEFIDAGGYGCVQLVGDVWEWTASDFTAYPGFESFPYREYSEVFLGPDYKVLRGGSWATDPIATRNTFRNWDYPIRRQIFAGFRTARDAV